MPQDELLAFCFAQTKTGRKTPGSAASQELIAQMLKSLDKNGDGRINRAELKAIALTDSSGTSAGPRAGFFW